MVVLIFVFPNRSMDYRKPTLSCCTYVRWTRLGARTSDSFGSTSSRRKNGVCAVAASGEIPCRRVLLAVLRVHQQRFRWGVSGYSRSVGPEIVEHFLCSRRSLRLELDLAIRKPYEGRIRSPRVRRW